MQAILQAVFFERKNGGDTKEFSTKKAVAVVYATLVAIDQACLYFGLGTHWTERLAAANVPESVIVALVTGELGLAGWLFKIYKDGKAQGAA